MFTHSASLFTTKTLPELSPRRLLTSLHLHLSRPIHFQWTDPRPQEHAATNQDNSPQLPLRTAQVKRRRARRPIGSKP